jgi:hypothetical protein
MPEGEEARPEQIALIEKWIAGGAKTLRPSLKTRHSSSLPKRSAFGPSSRYGPPIPWDKQPKRKLLSFFLQQKLAERSLTLPGSTKETLIRRTTSTSPACPNTRWHRRLHQ